MSKQTELNQMNMQTYHHLPRDMKCLLHPKDGLSDENVAPHQYLSLVLAQIVSKDVQHFTVSCNSFRQILL